MRFTEQGMKPSRHWKPLLFIVLSLAGLFFLFLKVRQMNESLEDFCPDRGYGETSLLLKIADANSKAGIDSVRLVIRYGASAEKLTDTVFKQQDPLEYSFDIPKTSECEVYWFEVSHPLYCPYSNETTGIKNGQTNQSLIHLKPAATVKAEVINKLKGDNADTVFLDIHRANESEIETWDYFTFNKFKKNNSISTFIKLESGIRYQAEWIRKNRTLNDTIIREFHILPFDTLHLKFELQ